MTANRPKTFFKLILTIAMVATIMGVLPAHAQEYKETFNSALEAARAKDFAGAIDLFSRAADAAKAEGDAEVERRSKELISKIEYQVGNELLKADRLDEAIAHFANGILQYPTYAKNYLARASSLKKKDEMDAAIAGFVETISVATAESDSKTARSAEEAIRGHYIFLASSTLSRNGSRASQADADEALGYITTLQAYIEADSDVYYYLAEIHKLKGEFQDAIEMADQALTMHRGSNTDKAKIYYVKGEALMSLGDTNGAKSAFQNAVYGPYKNSAEHYLETLGTE